MCIGVCLYTVCVCVRVRACACVCVCVYGQGALPSTDVNSRISGWDFPGSPVVRLCSFSAGGAGLIPGQGTRSHVLCGQKKRKEFQAGY